MLKKSNIKLKVNSLNDLQELEQLLRCPDEETIHIIGHLIGDGGVWLEPYGSRKKIYYCNNNPQLLTHFQEMFERKFKRCIHLTGGYKKNSKSILQRHDVRLVELILKYYPCCLAKHKYVPEIKERKLAKSLLKALIEDECHEHRKGLYQFDTTSKIYAETFRKLCDFLDLKPTTVKPCLISSGDYKSRYLYYFYFGNRKTERYILVDTHPFCYKQLQWYDTKKRQFVKRERVATNDKLFNV